MKKATKKLIGDKSKAYQATKDPETRKAHASMMATARWKKTTKEQRLDIMRGILAPKDPENDTR